MTCLTPPVCRPAADDLVGRRATASPVRDREHTTAATRLSAVRSDEALPQFLRFVLVGGTTTLVYALLFLALGAVGYMPAHLAATVVSSILANELHRRLTFRAEDRVHWLAAQVEAGTVSVIGLVATSAALAWLEATAASAPAAVQIGVVAAVTAVIGGLRFAALRWIFRPAEVGA